ncbi:MAG: hypothetical protein ACXABY_27700 [Candidatus Thorarchaeota archaeon]|jgi:hypothetical protein
MRNPTKLESWLAIGAALVSLGGYGLTVQNNARAVAELRAEMNDKLEISQYHNDINQIKDDIRVIVGILMGKGVSHEPKRETGTILNNDLEVSHLR